MSNWKGMLKQAFEDNKEDFSKMICTLTEEEQKVEFYSGYGGSEGKPFTAWGEKYVYFPVVYDGSEWVGSAPRDPCDEETEHVGGE
jgi:hypothetical protein